MEREARFQRQLQQNVTQSIQQQFDQAIEFASYDITLYLSRSLYDTNQYTHPAHMADL